MNKHVPMRTCVICRAKKPRASLARYSCPGEPGGSLEPDPNGTAEGRGFYTCREQSCMEKIDRFRGWTHKCKGVS